MTGKEAKRFFKDKFKQSLHKDIVFWITLILSVMFFVFTYIRDAEFYLNFWDFLRFRWSSFGLWAGVVFLLTRNYDNKEDGDGNENLGSQHLKSLYRVLLLVVIVAIPFFALIILPILGVGWVKKTEEKRILNEKAEIEESNQSAPKIALASLVCSGLAVPLLFGITALQGVLISSGVLHRRDALAEAGIGFMVGIVFAIAGIILWVISRKDEGRHVWNFWAMRLIIVNVILAPFVLVFMFMVAISRAK